MNADKIKDTLQNILVTLLNRPLPTGDEDAWLGMTGWDSLKQVEILLALEEEFNIRFAEEEFPDLDNAAKIFALTQIKCSEEPAANNEEVFSYY